MDAINENGLFDQFKQNSNDLPIGVHTQKTSIHDSPPPRYQSNMFQGGVVADVTNIQMSPY